MKDALSARIWSWAVLGFGVLAVLDAVLLVYAWANFATAKPEYFAHEWPTFSRTLTLQDALCKWLAAFAGAGLFVAAPAVAVMHWRRARANPQCRAALLGMMVCAIVAMPIAVVHYFHITVTLSADNDLHMALAYTLFFGLSVATVGDALCSIVASKAGLHDAATVSPRRLRAHQRVGLGILVSAAVFLVTFVLKDAVWNPWASATQKVFVCAEMSWVVLAHLYAVLWITPVRAYFGRESSRAAAPSRKLARPTALVALAAAMCAVLLQPEAHGATAAAAIGGTGRIQPAGGLIVVSGPPGRSVAQVLVKEGERVRKGAPLLLLDDQPLRSLEREVAAERLRNAEQLSVERRKSIELELEGAKLTLAHARSEAGAVASLDERTFPTREKRQRENAVSQASVAVQLATARLDESRKTSEAELRLARMSLRLAEAALLTARVLAPADATVLEVHAQPGSSGGPAVTLADISRMYVVADFFEGDLPKLAVGKRVKVSNNALGQTLEGVIERVGRVVDPVNRLAKVWVRLDKTAPADRFIGMQVDVKVDGEAPAKDRAS